jgi:hypothetical protein
MTTKPMTQQVVMTLREAVIERVRHRLKIVIKRSLSSPSVSSAPPSSQLRCVIIALRCYRLQPIEHFE